MCVRGVRILKSIDHHQGLVKTPQEMLRTLMNDKCVLVSAKMLKRMILRERESV